MDRWIVIGDFKKYGDRCCIYVYIYIYILI